jgi:hypothetical protein
VVLAVNSEKSGPTFKDLLERGKNQQMTYSSSGLGTMGHLVGANFVNLSKIKSEHVPQGRVAGARSGRRSHHLGVANVDLELELSARQYAPVVCARPSSGCRTGPTSPPSRSRAILISSPRSGSPVRSGEMPPAIVKKLNEEVTCDDQPEGRAMRRDG